MSDVTANNPIDLGSAPSEDFDPFASDDDLADDGDDDIADDGIDEAAANAPESQPAKEEVQAPAPKQTQTAAASGNASDADTTASGNPLENALDAVETKDAEKAKMSLFEKPPVFNYANATEDIEDASQTFDELRIAKATDFPELEDGKRVSWTVEYGKITKSVADAKGMTIAKMKSDIETSKEFLDSLKKARDKNPACKVKPRVTAQSKGTASGYKGVFKDMDEVDAAGKVISILPAKDGKVYEVRDTHLGRFITPVVGSEMLSDVRAGFIPAPGIPRIPMDLVMRIIAFFRYLTLGGGDNEALVNIYWDSHGKTFVVDTPEQIVSKLSVHSNENPDYLNERFIHFMDIHSHNSMRAFFSATDNKDEKATRLYTVIGRLDKYFPEIKTRISNGGKFHEIDPSEVFEYIARPFPDVWKEKVKFRERHNDDRNGLVDSVEDKYSCRASKSFFPWNDDICHNRNEGGCDCEDGDSP